MRSERATARRSTPMALAAILVAATTAGCVPFGMRGDGDVKSETRQVGAFTKVDASAGIGVTVRIGPAEPVAVEAQENLLAIIRTEVQSGTLRIDSTEGFTSSQSVHVTVVAPTLDGVTLSGGSQATIEGLASERLSVALSGGSALTATGSADTLDVNASGGSRANLADLSAMVATFDVPGGSVVNLRASELVTGVASGGSRVTVFGDATLDVQTSGGAEVSRG